MECLTRFGAHGRGSFAFPVPIMCPIVVTRVIEQTRLVPGFAIRVTQRNVVHSSLTSFSFCFVDYNPRTEVGRTLVETRVLLEELPTTFGHITIFRALVPHHVVE